MIATLKKIAAAKAARENNEGFTLIELLIVIVVLGILAGVVVFSLGNVTGSSAVAACQADGASLNTAITAYNAQNATALATTADLSKLVPNYLQSLPSNTTHYLFTLSSGALQVATPTGTAVAWTGASTCTNSGANKTVA